MGSKEARKLEHISILGMPWTHQLVPCPRAKRNFEEFLKISHVSGPYNDSPGQQSSQNAVPFHLDLNRGF
jgi:hypothetical protein